MAPASGSDSKRRRLMIMAGITTIFAAAELGGGLYTHSVALFADAFHMIGDIASLLAAAKAVSASKRSRTFEMTYGWARAEVLAAFANAIFLLALSFSILVSSLERFLQPEDIREPEVMVAVAAGGVVTNLLSLFVLGGHSHDHGYSHGHGSAVRKLPSVSTINSDSVAEEEQPLTTSLHPHLDQHHHGHHHHGHGHEKDMNLHGVFLHILGDCLGALGTVAAGLIIWLTDWSFKEYFDPVVSSFIAILIAVHTIPLLKGSAKIIMMGSDEDAIRSIELQLLQLSAVEGIHDLHVWQLSQSQRVGTVHVRVAQQALSKGVHDLESVMDDVRKVFEGAGVNAVTVQPECGCVSHPEILMLAGAPSSSSDANVVFAPALDRPGMSQQHLSLRSCGRTSSKEKNSA